MLNVGWPELMVIGVVALLVIGPKDLPEMFRQLGRFTAKLRQMSREFQKAMDEAARQAGVSDVAKDLKDATSNKALGLDGLKSAADKFEKWDPLKNVAKPTVAPKPVVLPGASPAATPAAGAVGPETQALYDKQAARAEALREYNAKIKAIETQAAAPAPEPVAAPAAAAAAEQKADEA